jgi:hypothetical protein
MNVFIRSWGKSVDGANFVGTHFLFLQNSEQKSYFSSWIVCVELAGREPCYIILESVDVSWRVV